MTQKVPLDFGKEMGEVLFQSSQSILMFDGKPNYSDDCVLYACMIFSSVIMDKMHDLMEKEDMKLEYRLQMVNKCGEEIRKIVHTFTGIDTVELAKE